MIVFVVISILVFLSIIFSSIFLLLTDVKWWLLKGKRLANLPLCSMGCLLSELWHYIFYPISQGMTSSFIWLTSPCFAWLFSTSLMYPMGLFAISFQFAKSQTPSSSLAQVWSETRFPTLGPASWRERPSMSSSRNDQSWLFLVVKGQMSWSLRRKLWPDTWWNIGCQKTPFSSRIALVLLFENLTFSKRILEEEVLGKRVLVVTNSFHALRAGVFMRRLKIPGRSIGSRTAFTISHPLGFEKPLAWFHFIGNGMLPSSFSISALVLYTNHETDWVLHATSKLKEAGQNCPAFYAW